MKSAPLTKKTARQRIEDVCVDVGAEDEEPTAAVENCTADQIELLSSR